MEILLIYIMATIQDLTISEGPNVSDKIFDSVEECQVFVNTLAGNNVFENNRFRFVANDGVIFYGGCMTPMEYEIYKEDLTLPGESV